MPKVIVDWQHDPSDLAQIHLAVVSTEGQPQPDQWLPALRDTVDGRPVVWVRVAEVPRRTHVWLRTRDGVRSVKWRVG